MNNFGDYSGYINSLKYKSYKNNFCCQNILDLKNDINNLTNTVEDLSKTETLYNDIDNNCKRVSISTIYHTTFINPQQDIIINKQRIFILPANPSIANGFEKTIVNNIKLSQTNTVSIYCVNSNNQGGFNNLGKTYNMYHFAFQGDNLELLWNSSENAWTIIKYNSIFENVIINNNCK
jgi:hypothetical protein